MRAQPDPPPLAPVTQSDPSLLVGVGGPGELGGDERLAATRNGQQLWVQGSLWNPRRVAGAHPGGDSHRHGRRGRQLHIDGLLEEYSVLGRQRRTAEAQPEGSGSLQAANPVGSKVPGMEIVATTVLPVVLPPEDRARDIAVRVVRGLPYAFILGASFFRTNSSVISLGEGKGFQASPGSPWVPF